MLTFKSTIVSLPVVGWLWPAEGAGAVQENFGVAFGWAAVLPCQPLLPLN